MDSRLGSGSPVRVGDRAARRLVTDLLAAHPGAAIAFINPASNLGDVRELLGESGIDIGTHTMLRGKAGAEFVVPTDAWLVGAAATDANEHGQGTRTVQLKDGRAAAMHLIRVDEPRLSTGFAW